MHSSYSVMKLSTRTRKSYINESMFWHARNGISNPEHFLSLVRRLHIVTEIVRMKTVLSQRIHALKAS